jgi:hypothetical protein
MDEELGDQQWVLIAPLLPKPKGRGRPRAEDRRTLNGILWVLRSGARWKDLPPKYGSRSTCHRRLQEWQDPGVGTDTTGTLIPTSLASCSLFQEFWGRFIERLKQNLKKGENNEVRN